MKTALPIAAALLFGLAMPFVSAQEATAQAAPAPVAEAATAAGPAAAPAVEASTAVDPVAAPTPAAAPSSLLPKEVTDMVGTPQPGKALVVFFRPKRALGAMIGFIVREDKTELGKLRNGNYFAAQVAPGKHTYVVHSEAKDLTSIEAEDGETYFVSGEITMGFMAGRPNLSPSTVVNFQAEAAKLKPSKALD